MKWLIMTLIFLLPLLLSTLAFAQGWPTSILIEGVKVYRHLAEDNDQLFVARYSMTWSTVPDQPISDLFLGKLMVSDEVKGTIALFEFRRKSYETGIFSIYLPASSAITWGSTAELILQGNPLRYDDPPIAIYEIQSADWVSADNSTQYKKTLGSHVINWAKAIEEVWGKDTWALLVETDIGAKLNSLGTEYFCGAIPGLRSVCPDIFQLTIVSPQVSPTTWERTYEKQVAARLESGPIGTGLKGLESWLGPSWKFWGGMIIVGFYVAFLLFTTPVFHSVTPGLIIGIPIIIIGSLMGLLPMSMVFVMVFLVILLLGYHFFFKRA